MGVQQQIELQGQSVKYFHLREDTSNESFSDSESQPDNNNNSNGGSSNNINNGLNKDGYIQPRLSIWGWFTPSQYNGHQLVSNGIGMKSLSASEDSISLSNDNDGSTSSLLNHHHHNDQPMLMVDSSNLSDSEDGASNEKNFKIDVPLIKEDGTSTTTTTTATTLQDDDSTKIKYNTRNNTTGVSTLRTSSNKTSNTVLSQSAPSISQTSISIHSPTITSGNGNSKYLYTSIDQSNGLTIRYPYSPAFSDATFTILCGVVVLFSIIYSLLVGPVQIMFAFLVSILVFVSYICASFAKNNRAYLYSITALSIGLGLCIPSFFAATGAVVLGTDRGKSTWDSQLYRSDEVLMGWIWKHGQMALFIDDSKIIGPYSFIGRLSTEIFQLSYISYYIWGYFMEIYILYNLWRCHLSKDVQQQKMLPIWDQRLKMFINSWISTYFIVFSINLMFPAESPRVYIDKLGLYKNPLNGFGFAGFIRNKIQSAAKGSFGSFPSGHIATSFAIGLSSYRILPAYGFVSTVAAILIAIATMYLRYHYFVDFLAALPVTFFCLLYGGFYTVSDFKNVFVNAFNFIISIFKNIISKFKNNNK